MNSYEPIWNRIKLKNSASLVTHPNSVDSIIKAVINLKHRDTGYKLELSERALKAKLNISQELSKINNSVTIHFSLTTSIKESYIGVNTL